MHEEDGPFRCADGGFLPEEELDVALLLDPVFFTFHRPYFSGICARIRRLIAGRGGLDGTGYRNAGYVPEAAAAPRARAPLAAGNPREGSRHLADPYLARVRGRSARARLRSRRRGTEARRALRAGERQPAAALR